jgi:short-subunit dehydrogenase
MNLNSKVALVTGSTQGIGNAVAETLLQAGAKVVINSRNENKVNGTLKELSPISKNVLGLAGDISKEHAVQNLFRQINEKWGSVDILVNNAGIAKFSPILETSENDWDHMQNINLKGVFLCSKAVLPDMIEKKCGHILTINSVAGKKTFQNCSAYGSSKAGALSFMNVLREEVRQFGIHVTSIIAGATATPIWDSLAGDFPTEKMMNTNSIALTVLSAIEHPSGMVEEIHVRPVGGDL